MAKMNGAERAKEWRKNNPEKVKTYSKKRYLEKKEQISNTAKEWATKNKDRVASNRRKYRSTHKEYERMGAKTRLMFKGCKEECKDCGEKRGLQFHHLQPLAYDNFKVLCRDCHRKEHGVFASKTTWKNEEAN